MHATTCASAVLAATAAVGVLVAADHVLQPVPVVAATTTLGGLAGLLGARNRHLRWVTAGAAAGFLVGLLHHVWVHGSDRSPPATEGLPLHVLTDAGTGLAAAVIALVAATVVRRLV